MSPVTRMCAGFIAELCRTAMACACCGVQCCQDEYMVDTHDCSCTSDITFTREDGPFTVGKAAWKTGPAGVHTAPFSSAVNWQ